MTERIRWSYDDGIEKLRALCDVWNGFEKRLLIPFLGIEEFDHFLVHVGNGDTPCSKTLIEVEEGDYIERDENCVYSVAKAGKTRCEDCGEWVDNAEIYYCVTTYYNKEGVKIIAYRCGSCDKKWGNQFKNGAGINETHAVEEHPQIRKK